MTTSTRSPSGPEERQALLVAASAVLREGGAQALRVDDVLGRAGLGTRAFYRHFESKDHLVVAVFADAARAEADRLRALMGSGAGPLDSVVAWIQGRLDLAFDAGVQSDLQHVSRQAQAVNATSPETMAEVHGAMLAPLVEQIDRGTAAGVFASQDPVADALSVDAVTWACIERQWAGAGDDPVVARERVLRFCLRALGQPAG